MIKKLKSKLAIKVFLLTAVLMAACCSMMYVCILRFAPYIYVHDLEEAELIASELVLLLSGASKEEAGFYIQDFDGILAEYTEEEFVFHIFNSFGEELRVPELDVGTGKTIESFEAVKKTECYPLVLQEREEEYLLCAAQNMDKESQVVEALEKAVPFLSGIVLLLSVVAAFFYTWYMTRPIKKISKISKQMAELDFGGLCPVKRTDEIGVLAVSLNELSGKLSSALLKLQEANQKLQADIDQERLLEQQRLEFFSAASHELKTPITIIKGQLQGMLYQIGRYKDRETYLAQSLEATGTLESMVQELLTISRLETPGYSCHKKEFDISELVARRLAVCEDLLLQKGLKSESFLSPDLFLYGDERLLEKVLDNLLGNAAAYSPSGESVIVKLWTSAIQTEKEKKINLSVENTGVHIPEEELPRLFEAFYRVDPSRNRQTGGSGLGLYIVKTILDLHKADIQIFNTEKGVKVLVQL